MDKPGRPALRTMSRYSVLGLLIATQGFAGMPRGGEFNWGYHPGFRGGFRGPFYGHGYGRWRGWGPGFFYPVLPLGCVAIAFGGASWYYGDGYWYRPYELGYMADYPPVGITVTTLPPGCVSFAEGGVTYYSANNVYYTAAGQGYAVAAPPPGRTPSQPAAGTPDAVALDALVIFPKNGQSEVKMLADRQEARTFASNRTGYDPAHSDPNDPGTPRARKAFMKSMRTYLEDHGYAVH